MGSNRVLNGDPSTGTAYQRPVFVGRNTIRLPNWFELNARYSRVFPLRERMQAEFIVESTNLLNRVNITNLNTTATVNEVGIITTPAPLNPTAAADQRLLQFGVRLSF